MRRSSVSQKQIVCLIYHLCVTCVSLFTHVCRSGYPMSQVGNTQQLVWAKRMSNWYCPTAQRMSGQYCLVHGLKELMAKVSS